jgi:hypothetical protein
MIFMLCYVKSTVEGLTRLPGVCDPQSVVGDLERRAPVATEYSVWGSTWSARYQSHQRTGRADIKLQT